MALHRRLSYVPGDVSLWPNLTGGEAIDYLTRLHRGSTDPAALKSRKAALLESFELDPTKKARTYSKGNRQKVALVAAFLVDPELYIFDEPTSGLDPLMEAVFTDHVRQVKAAGKAVLLSSHILSEVEKLCDTVTIIRSGRTVESGTIAELRHLTHTSVSALVAHDPSGLARRAGIHDFTSSRAGNMTQVGFSVDNTKMNDVMTALTGLGLHSLTATPPSVEELFMRHYGGTSNNISNGRRGAEVVGR
ncbi:hypothetical protein Apa02nite_067490 [Actinoplanes palleronii]|uniref:ABC transporter domain-containing protein n=1 Tax=Actinoplanes palleronii TaxID=113570 RepID=A0ABQ4BIY2_9ACTN|nr:hypothetical protein Apa02nite_067490 [Actinoplanes palleronii]